jgi:hypothetical protein
MPDSTMPCGSISFNDAEPLLDKVYAFRDE